MEMLIVSMMIIFEKEFALFYIGQRVIFENKK